MESSDDDDMEVLEFEDLALEKLRKGEFIVENSDGTFRCPFSPGRKKQNYIYKDLLQHACGVAQGKRGPEAAGNHSALVKYLKDNLAEKASAPVERMMKVEQAPPRRTDVQDLLVCPWSGVIYNIENIKRDKGLYVGLGVSEIKKYFAAFNPEKAHVFWGPRGHLGMGLVTFRRDLEGLKDAQAFEKWFIENDHGRKDYERNRTAHKLGKGFYGWLARKEDYNGRGEFKEEEIVSQYLKELGDLKDVGMVGEEIKRIHDQRVQHLAETVSEKNREYEELQDEIAVAKKRAEFERSRLEEKHQLELGALMGKANKAAHEHRQAMARHQQKLLQQTEQLNKREKELSERELYLKNETDKSRLFKEREENRLQMDMVNQHAEMQKKHQAEQVKLISKHEAENQKLAEYIHQIKLKLANKQNSEMKHQQLSEILETEKFKELTSPETSNHVKELQEELQELKEENEGISATINQLMVKEKVANDELENARKVALEIVPKLNCHEIVIKKMGEIAHKPWLPAGEKMWKPINEDWMAAVMLLKSEWDDRIRDPEYQPFKMVNKGDDKWEQQIDQTDALLCRLKKDLGEEAYNSVTTALKEIEEYNASGRYPIPIVWNSVENRRATLAEVITQMSARISPVPTRPKRQRRALQV